MPSDRLSVVLSTMASIDGNAPSVLDRICAAAVELLSITGAGLSLMADGELRGTAAVSEPGIARVQELQLELGEGPCIDAWKTLEPVLEPDLDAPDRTRWPAFARAGVEAGVRAIFAFPLRLGAIRIGVLVLYRDRPGALSNIQFDDGIVLADLAASVVLGLQAGSPVDQLHELLASEPPHWSEIHQATGMVSVQLGVSLEEAFARLRGHAFAESVSLRVVAQDVVARRLRLEPSQ